MFHLRPGEMTFDNLVRFMYRPTDPASLGVVRALFGLMMLLDIPEERGGAELDLRWGDPMRCHFPLVPLDVAGLPFMALIYAAMWLGAAGIMLGYKFGISSVLFAVPYWYLFLLEKSYWNNHSYLFGLVALLLVGTQANNFLSIDAHVDASKRDRPVPYWNYFILKYQLFVLYFVAGLKKSDREWLSGYAMTNLSSHWVFEPFRLFMSIDQTDYLIVHWFAFVFDLTVCFWMMYEYTRPVAMIFCASFHLMNSRLFSIGMFPWVCLSTMPLFCPPDWPRTLYRYITEKYAQIKSLRTGQVQTNDQRATIVDNKESGYEKSASVPKTDKKDDDGVNFKRKLVVCLLMTHMGVQAFLPYSHFITKGYNNWTNGLYGYSWDMMVNTWDTVLIVIKVVDNDSKNETYLDPDAWTPNNRWSRHGDMMHQYATCLERNYLIGKRSRRLGLDLTYEMRPPNLSVHIDVWCSMNGRVQQRMFDPSYDLLKVRWSPFERVEWLLPLLSEFDDWRQRVLVMQDEIYSWNNYTEALFVADFPGLHLENYVTPDLYNVTLTVLEGQVYLETASSTKKHRSESTAVHLTQGESYPVATGVFHKVHTVGDKPSNYMYTYMNSTKRAMVENYSRNKVNNAQGSVTKAKLPLWSEFTTRVENIVAFWKHIADALLYLIYGVPMIVRVEA